MKAEHCRSLDVNRLHREGCLRPGWCGNWQWTRAGERVASIGLRSTAQGLRLTYRIRSGGGDDDWQKADYTVPLAWSPCTKGGRRPYVLCPGVRVGRSCGWRVAKLYLGMYRPWILRHLIAVMRPRAWCPSGRVGTGLASGGHGARSASVRCRSA